MNQFVLFLFCSLFLIKSSFAAIDGFKQIKPTEITEMGSLVKMDSKIKMSEEEITSLRLKINKMENTLNVKNENLIDLLDRKKQMEEDLSKVKVSLFKEKEFIGNQVKKTKLALSQVVLGNLEDEGGPEVILIRKMLEKKLLNQISKLNSSSKNTIELEEKIKLFAQKLEKTKQDEQFISKLLKDLEEEKGKLASIYMENVQKRDELRYKYDRLKTQMVLGSHLSEENVVKHDAPLDSFVKFDYRDKGITFFYKGVKPITSTADGKVIYSGNLSAYGNVVMVDHGNDNRSVILGSFIPKIKKGDEVKKGDLLGYTKELKDRLGKVYFEIRKKDKVQNTIYFMDRKFISKNKLDNEKENVSKI